VQPCWELYQLPAGKVVAVPNISHRNEPRRSKYPFCSAPRKKVESGTLSTSSIALSGLCVCVCVCVCVCYKSLGEFVSTKYWILPFILAKSLTSIF
jgi:hypothetical protein